MLGKDRAAGIRLLGRAGDDPSAERLDQTATIRLLVVRDLDHPHVDLEAEDLPRECERRAPLPRARLRREALHAFGLVVVRLRNGSVRLVRAGRRHALVLVVDACRCLECSLEAPRAIERRRPPLAVDGADLLGNGDEAVRRDLLADDRHREERREVVRADGLPGARVQNGRRRRGEIGGDVVPGLRKPALVEDVLHLVGHLALLSMGRRRFRSLSDSPRKDKEWYAAGGHERPPAA